MTCRQHAPRRLYVDRILSKDDNDDLTASLCIIDPITSVPVAGLTAYDLINISRTFLVAAHYTERDLLIEAFATIVCHERIDDSSADAER